jgi:hypothetical protein
MEGATEREIGGILISTMGRHLGKLRTSFTAEGRDADGADGNVFSLQEVSIVTRMPADGKGCFQRITRHFATFAESTVNANVYVVNESRLTLAGGTTSDRKEHDVTDQRVS